MAIGLSVFAAATIVRSNALSSRPLLLLLALAVVTILLSISPAVVLVGWLALAPLLQNSASHTAVGHPLQLGLYVLPPLVFLLWSLTASSRSRSASFIDFLPLAYFLLLLGSMFFTSDVTFPAIKDLYTNTGIGIIAYYLVAFGPLRSNIQERVVGAVMTLATIEALMSIVDGLTKWNLWHDTSWQGASVGTYWAVSLVSGWCWRPRS
jgi:hypothetical protein